MDRNSRVITKEGPATVIGFLSDGTIVVDPDKTIATELVALKEKEVEFMKTADELKKELADAVLETRAELQDITEDYWRKWIAEIKAIFAQKVEYLKSVKAKAKAQLISLRADATAKIAEYNGGRRY